ncbi:MAG: biotin--[acetyl-CoA-carboxylase] ligase [Thermoanaerobaculia bacterium]
MNQERRTAATASYGAWVAGLALAAERSRVNLVSLPTVTSTNDLARRVVADYLDDQRLPRRSLLAAWEQTAGRGRRGRSWSSPAGHGLYATWIEPLIESRLRERLPLIVAIALADGVRELIDAPCAVKWPNDLMVERRKIGGILIDVVDRQEVGAVALIGFGVNYSHPPSTLPRRPATSLVECGEAPGLDVVCQTLIERLANALMTSVGMEDLVQRYRRLSLHKEGDQMAVQVGTERLEGAFAGFDAAGKLRLEVDGEERRIASGEVFDR